MARSPVSPGGSRSRTRHASLVEELSVEEPEIMRDIVSAEAKWRKELKSVRAEVAERRRALARQSESRTSATT